MNDKLLHFGAGLLVALFARHFVGPGFGVLAAILAGAAKEAYDALGNGVVDPGDFVATVAGGVVVEGALEIIAWS